MSSFQISIAGLVPFTTIDFPDRLAAVLFLQGCPLRCPFCHNSALQKIKSPSAVSVEEIEIFLKTHKNRLDGIVLSGGEPLMQKDIVSFAKWIKSFGYQIGIHTSGAYPQHLKELLPLLDWVGIDVKAPWKKYNCLTGSQNIDVMVQKSLDILSANHVPFEARTTCDPRHLTIEDIYQIVSDVEPYHVNTYALQHYRSFDDDSNPPLSTEIESFFNDEKLISFLKKSFNKFIIR